MTDEPDKKFLDLPIQGPSDAMRTDPLATVQSTASHPAGFPYSCPFCDMPILDSIKAVSDHIRDAHPAIEAQLDRIVAKLLYSAYPKSAEGVLEEHKAPYRVLAGREAGYYYIKASKNMPLVLIPYGYKSLGFTGVFIKKVSK